MDGLLRKIAAYKQKNPRTYARNIAADLGITEARLLVAETFAPNASIVRLKNQPQAILAKAAGLGRLMILCRNEYAVSEISGEMQCQTMSKENTPTATASASKARTNEVATGTSGTCVQFRPRQPPTEDGIKMGWHATLDIVNLGYIFNQKTEQRFSIQLFNTAGVAMQKIFCPKHFPMNTFQEFFATESTDDDDHRHNDSRNDSHNDSHNKKEDLQKLATDSIPLEPNAIRQAILTSAKNKTPIRVTVANADCTQIFQGTIDKAMDARGWFNILDSDFSLHLNEKLLDKCYQIPSHTRTDWTSVAAYTKQKKIIQVEYKNET